jgi:hypothetical protein
MRNRTLVCCWLLQAALHAQTQIDLRTQSKTVDFSAAASTQPAKKGTTLPSTCVAGEQFFKTDAAAGQNLYLCALANTWTQSGQIPATVAATNQSNTYTAGTQDFRGAAHTLPALTGTAAGKPATCTTGEQYFATDAAAGQNLFYCTSANTWTQQVNANCSTCVTAPAPLTNLNIMAGAGSQTSKITNILADTGLNNLLVPGTVTTGDGSAAGELSLYELAANGTMYFSWLGVDSRATTLRAKIPTTDPTAGQVMLFGAPVGGISTITWGNPGSGGGGGTGAPNYTQSFTSVTTVSLTHGLGTKNLILACLDANDTSIEPAAWSIGQSAPFNIAVTFVSPQTGRCVVNGAGGRAEPSMAPRLLRRHRLRSAAQRTI